MKLKLLTFNTLGTPFFAKDITQRYKKIAEIINDSNTDIVCLQEIFSFYNQYLFKKWLTGYPYKIAKPSPFGLHGGLAIYSKVPIDYVRFHRYIYPEGIAIPFYTRLARSGFLVCKLREIPLILATTHLTTDTIHDLTPANKRYRLIRSQILQAADVFKEQENSVILTGDFNTGKDSMLYKEFLRVTGVKDTFATHNEITYSPERTPYRFPAEESSRIDYIFYKQNKLKIQPTELTYMFKDQVTLFKGKQSYVSDHIALSATLKLI